MKISRAALSGLAAALFVGGLAFTTAAPAAATNDNANEPCYAQVQTYEYQFERTVTVPHQHTEYSYKKSVEDFKTQYEIDKYTRERTRTKLEWTFQGWVYSPWSDWSAPARWPGNTHLAWVDTVPAANWQDHDGNGDNGEYDRDWTEWPTGATRQVANGSHWEYSGWVLETRDAPWVLIESKVVQDAPTYSTETSAWLPTNNPPAGEGWTFKAQRDGAIVQGPATPCRKIWICHKVEGQGELKNGYNLIHVSYKAADGEGNNDHTSHVGDIIPAPGDGSSTCGAGPDSKVVTVDSGDPTCGSITVATTTTTTPYVFVNGKWTEGTPTSVAGTRPLTENEKAKLGPNCIKADDITYSEWTGEYECGNENVAETRTATVIHFTYNVETGQFTAGSPVVTTQNRTRPATDKERGDDTCRPEKPPLVITEDIGEPECGSATVDTRTTTTIYSYTFEEGQWVESSVQQLAFGTRPLTENEKAKLGPNFIKADDITYSEWTGEYECGNENVAETRTATVIHFTYNVETGQFTAGSPVVTTQNRTRPATDKERGDDTCRPEKPPLVITEDIGEPECGSATVDSRTTTTIYSYTFEEGQWVESSVQQLAFGTRPLTENEKATLDEECVVGPNLTFVTPAGPELVAPTCDVAGGYKVRGQFGVAKEAGITYAVSVSTDPADESGTIVIEASAEAGSVIPEGARKTWKVSPSQIARLTGDQCGTPSAITPTEPSFAAIPPVQPAQTPPPPTTGATTTVDPTSVPLPVTGGSPWTMLWVALAALGAGYVAVRMSRRSTS